MWAFFWRKPEFAALRPTVHGGDDPITDDLQSPVPPPRTSTSEQEGQGHGPNKPKMVG